MKQQLLIYSSGLKTNSVSAEQILRQILRGHLMAGRNTQVSRIYCILDLLEQAPQGLSISEIHARATDRGHDASKRTVYRDLEALSDAGFPLFPESDKTSDGSQRWRLDRSAKVNQYFILNARELFALFLARGALTPLRETPFFSDLQAIFQKLEQKLGNRNVEHLRTLEDEVKFEPGPAWGLGLNPEILETLRAACSESHCIEAEYASVNSKTLRARKIGPHYLYYARGGLYLVGEDLEQQKTKVFALPRFKSATMLDQSYEGTISTPEDVFNGSLGAFTGTKIEKIIVEFKSDVASFVKERRWHSSQRIVQLEGDRIQVSLEVAETPELYSWILGFGPSARVIAPSTLAERIAVMAMETVSLYENKTGT